MVWVCLAPEEDVDEVVRVVFLIDFWEIFVRFALLNQDSAYYEKQSQF